MPIFQYTVRDTSGEVHTGTTEAENVEVLKYRLQQQGFTITAVGDAPSGYERKYTVRVSRNEVLVFWIQFSIMIDKAVSPVHALNVTADRADSMRFGTVLKDVSIKVCSGEPFHKALACYPNVFDTATIGIIHAGETANALSDAVHRLIQFMERDRKRG